MSFKIGLTKEVLLMQGTLPVKPVQQKFIFSTKLSIITKLNWIIIGCICSTLVYFAWLLDHMIYLNLRRKLLLSKMSKLKMVKSCQLYTSVILLFSELRTMFYVLILYLQLGHRAHLKYSLWVEDYVCPTWWECLSYVCSPCFIYALLPWKCTMSTRIHPKSVHEKSSS